MLALKPYLEAIKIHLTNEAIDDIINAKYSTVISVLYQIYLASQEFDNNMEDIGMSADEYKHNLGIMLDNLQSSETSKLSNVHNKEPMDENDDTASLNAFQDIKDSSQVLLYSSGDSQVFNSSEFIRNVKKGQNLMEPTIQDEIKNFEDNILSVQNKSHALAENFDNNEYDEMNIAADFAPDAHLFLRIKENIKRRRQTEMRSRSEREKQRKRVLGELKAKQDAEDRQVYESQLVRDLLTRSDSVQLMVRRLMDSEQMERTVVRNRVERETQFQERRQADYLNQLDAARDNVITRGAQLADILKRDAKLHANLLQERRMQAKIRDQQFCLFLIGRLVELSIITAEYKQNYNASIPLSFYNGWKEILISGDIGGSSATGKAEQDTSSGHIAPDQGDVRKQMHLDNYLNLADEWLLTCDDVKRKQTTLATSARSDCPILCHILKRLLSRDDNPTTSNVARILQRPSDLVGVIITNHATQGMKAIISNLADSVNCGVIDITRLCVEALQTFRNETTEHNRKNQEILEQQMKKPKIEPYCKMNGILSLECSSINKDAFSTKNSAVISSQDNNEDEIYYFGSISEDSIEKFEYSDLAILGQKINKELCSGRTVNNSLLNELITHKIRNIDKSGLILFDFPVSYDQCVMLDHISNGRNQEEPTFDSLFQSGITTTESQDWSDSISNRPYLDESNLQDTSVEKGFSMFPPFRRSRLVNVHADLHQTCDPVDQLWNIFAIEINMPNVDSRLEKSCFLLDNVEFNNDEDTEDKHLLYSSKFLLSDIRNEAIRSFFSQNNYKYYSIDANATEFDSFENTFQEIFSEHWRQIEAKADIQNDKLGRFLEAEQLTDIVTAEELSNTTEIDANGKRLDEREDAHRVEMDGEKKDKTRRTTQMRKKRRGSAAKSLTDQADQPLVEETVPEAPSCPDIGTSEYVYVNYPLDRATKNELSMRWMLMEDHYILVAKDCLNEIFGMRDQHSVYTDTSYKLFQETLYRKDDRNKLIERFMHYFISLNSRRRCDDEMKSELHLKVDELKLAIWRVIDTTIYFAEEHRYKLITSGWIQERLALSINYWIMLMENEVYRFSETSMLLLDYYLSQCEHSTPHEEIKMTSMKPAIAIVSRRSDKYSVLDKSSNTLFANSVSEVGSPKKLTRLKSMGIDVNFHYIDDLIKSPVFSRDMENFDFNISSLENLIESNFDVMNRYLITNRANNESKLQNIIGLNAQPKPPVKPKAKDKNKTPKNKTSTAPTTDRTQYDLVLSDRDRCRNTQAFEEYRRARNTEEERCLSRLKLISSKALAELRRFHSQTVSFFSQMWTSIKQHEKHLNATLNSLVIYLISQIENEELLTDTIQFDRDRLLIGFDRFINEAARSDSISSTISNPLEIGDCIHGFTGPQIKFLLSHLQTVCPGGNISSRALSLILQDLVIYCSNEPRLPQFVKQLSQQNVDNLVSIMSNRNPIISWKCMLLDLFQQRPIFDQRLLLNTLLHFKHSTWNFSCALSVIQHLYQHQFGEHHFAPENIPLVSAIAYSESQTLLQFLLIFCRHSNSKCSFLSALTLIEERLINHLDECSSAQSSHSNTGPTEATRIYSGMSDSSVGLNRRAASSLNTFQHVHNHTTTSKHHQYNSIARKIYPNEDLTSRKPAYGSSDLIANMTDDGDLAAEVTVVEDVDHSTAIYDPTHVLFNRSNSSCSLHSLSSRGMAPDAENDDEVNSEPNLEYRLQTEEDVFQSRTGSNIQKFYSIQELNQNKKKDFRKRRPTVSNISVGFQLDQSISWTQLSRCGCTHQHNLFQKNVLRSREISAKTSLNSLRKLFRSVIVCADETKSDLYTHIDNLLVTMHTKLYGNTRAAIKGLLDAEVEMPVYICDIWTHPDFCDLFRINHCLRSHNLHTMIGKFIKDLYSD